MNRYSPYFSAKKSALFLTAPLQKIGNDADFVDNKGKETRLFRCVDLASLSWVGQWSGGWMSADNAIQDAVGTTAYYNINQKIKAENYANGNPTNGNAGLINLWVTNGSKRVGVCNGSTTEKPSGILVFALATPTTATAVSVAKIGVQKGDNVITADTEVKPTKIKAKI